MVLLMILAVLSALLSILSYLLLVTPGFISPLLWLFQVSTPPPTLSQYTFLVAVSVQLLLIVLLYMLRDSRRKLRSRLQQSAKKNIELSERAKVISSQLSEQGKEMQTARTEAQRVVLLESQVGNLSEMLESLKSQNEELMRRNEKFEGKILRQSQAPAKGFVGAVKSWVRKVFP